MRVANSLRVLLNPTFKLNENVLGLLKSHELNRLAGYAYFLVIGSEQWDFVIDTSIEPPTLREIRELLYSAAVNPNTMGLKYELLFPWEDKMVEVYTDQLLLSDGESPEPHYIYQGAGKHYWPCSTADVYGERMMSYFYATSYLVPQLCKRPVMFEPDTTEEK